MSITGTPPWKRAWALLLSAAVIVTQLPAAMAEGSAPEGSTPKDGAIAFFTPLDSGVKSQSVPLGTGLDKLNLPETVTANVYRVTEEATEESSQDTGSAEESSSEASSETEDGETSSQEETTEESSSQDEEPPPPTVTVKVTTEEEQIPVTWESEPAYDGDKAGTYVFTADADGYTLSTGAEPPRITVTVGDGTEPPPCTKTEGCTLAEGHEGECATAAPVKTLLHWSFVEEENLNEGELALPGVNAENQADFDTVVSMLPKKITGTVQGEPDPATVDITWACAEYKQDDGGNWPLTGEYTFAAVLPDGYACEPPATVKALLGGANLYANTYGGLTITGAPVTQDMDGQIILDNGTYEISGKWTGTLTGVDWQNEKSVITVPDGKTADVTLNGVTIDVNSTGYACAFAVAAGGTANIILTGTNTLTSGRFRAGLEVPENAKVTIGGLGALNATGGVYGAGIGGSNSGSGTIEISGGTVTANGDTLSAGIGGGGGTSVNSGGNITISGGNVTAIGNDGAGIGGGGMGGSGGTIEISGGTVTANGFGGAGIGGSNGRAAGSAGNTGGSGGKITISGGYVTATSNSGAGIGGGNGHSHGGDGGDITVGGNAIVFATSQDPNTAHIGPGEGGNQGTKTLNNCIVFEGNTGTVYGSPELPEDVEIPSGYTLSLPDTSTLTVPNGVTLTLLDNVTVTNEGTITVNNGGTITGTGIIENKGSGQVINNGTVNVSIINSSGSGGQLVKGGLTVKTASGDSPTYTDGSGFTLGDGTYEISGTWTGTLDTSVGPLKNVITVPNGKTANVTLNSVTIDVKNTSRACAFAVAAGGTANIILTGTNTLTSGENRAGLEIPENAKVIIGGSGTLNATGGDGGAGIGGNNGSGGSGGAIEISGGTVKANGGTLSAGIGGGGGSSGSSDGGTITISSGNVTANGDIEGAGIGGGYDGSGGKITISGGHITATSNSGAGIGGGRGAGDSGSVSGGKITISGGHVTATSNDGAGIGGGYGTGNHGGDGGNVTIEGNAVVFATSQNPNAAHIGPGDGGSQGTKTLNNCIVFEGDTGKVYDSPELPEDVEIPSGSTLSLPDTSTLTVPNGVTLTLLDNVKVTNEGTITVNNGGTITGTGIIENQGSGQVINNGTVNVSIINSSSGGQLVKGGLTVKTASGDSPTYTEGSGFTLGNGTYEISGTWTGTLDTSVGLQKNVITVPNGKTADVTLNSIIIDLKNTPLACAFAVAAGGTANITLTGNNTLTSGRGCAGLEVPENATVTIDGSGTLNATGGNQGVGIGGGGYKGNGGTIEINGGTVTANGNGGIGGGEGGSGGTITINSGNVTANGFAGAGIGGGGDDSGGNGGSGGKITINGGRVTATSNYGAAIGGGGDGIGGNGGNGGKITISGGHVTATGKNGAGIGGGYGGNGNGGSGEKITISGGHVTATSNSGAGIGGGNGDSHGGDGGDITVEGNAAVFATSQNPNAAHIGPGESGSQGTKTLNKGMVFEGNTGKVYGSPELPQDVQIPSGSTLTVPDNSNLAIPNNLGLTNEGTIDNYGTVTGGGSIQNNGTINDYSGGITVTVNGNGINKPSQVEVTFWDSQGTAITKAAYGDIIKITAKAQRKSTKVRAAQLNYVDFYVGTIAPEHKLGTARGVSSGGTVTATLEITLSSDKGFVAGENTIAADFGGATNAYLSSTGTGVLTVLASPALTLEATPSGSQTFPGDVTLTATLTDAAPSNSGKSIQFTVNGKSAGTAVTDSSGKAAYTLQNLPVGTYTFKASFAGDLQNNSVNATDISNYTVSQGTQGTFAITGVARTYTYGDGPITLSTSGGSGAGTVSYTSSDPSVASVSGDTLTIHKAGTFTVTAVKAADGNYNQAVDTLQITVEKRPLTNAVITLAPGPYIYTGIPVTPAVTDVTVDNIPVPAAAYDVAYQNNTSTGTANVTITAKSDSSFSGTASTTFSITAPAPAPSDNNNSTPDSGSSPGGGTVGGSGSTGAPLINNNTVKTPMVIPNNQPMSRSSVKKLAGQNRSLTVQSGNLTISLPPAALNAILAAVPVKAGNLAFSPVPADLSKFPEAAKLIGNRPVYDFLVTYKDSKGNTVPVQASFPVGTVSIVFNYTPAVGEAPENLFVVYVDSKGAVTWLNLSNCDGKKVLASVSHLSIYGVAYKTPVPVFTDIENHWAKSHITFAAARGLLPDTSNNRFNPEGTLTESAFITALERLTGCAYSNTLPTPNAPLTRERMSVLLWDFSRRTGYTLPATFTPVSYADNSTNVTRAEVAELLHRLAAAHNEKIMR